MNNSEVVAQFALMQAQAAMKGEFEQSIWVVFNPKKVGVWCEKSGCPVTGRRTKVDTVTLRKSQTMSAFLTDEEEDSEPEEEEDDEFEVKVLRDHGPAKANHRLGVVAAFKSEREAAQFIETFYTNGQALFASMDADDIPLFEIEEVKVF